MNYAKRGNSRERPLTGLAFTTSRRISSMKYFVRPYGLVHAPTGWRSSSGWYCGSPYTVAELEKISFCTPCACITCASTQYRTHDSFILWEFLCVCAHWHNQISYREFEDIQYEREWKRATGTYVDEIDGGFEVVAIVEQRQAGRLAHCLQARHQHHVVDRVLHAPYNRTRTLKHKSQPLVRITSTVHQRPNRNRNSDVKSWLTEIMNYAINVVRVQWIL